MPQQQRILEVSLDCDRLEEMAVNEYVDLYVHARLMENNALVRFLPKCAKKPAEKSKKSGTEL